MLISDNYLFPKVVSEVYGEPFKSSDINQITSNYKRVWLVLSPEFELKDYKETTKEFKILILEKLF